MSDLTRSPGRLSGTLPAVSFDSLSLTVAGCPTPGDYTLPGNTSSQYFSGLLFTLPRLSGDHRIVMSAAIFPAA